MSDYFSPTVVRTTIPLANITPLEVLLLTSAFSSEPDGEGLYFFAEDHVTCELRLPVAQVQDALTRSADRPTPTAEWIAADLKALDDEATHLKIDLSDWDFLFQDIVRRSPSLSRVVVASAWTCSKMDREGFGGMAMVITADAVAMRSTDALIDEMIGIADYGPVGVEPGIGSHILLRLCEEQVRATVETIFETAAPRGLIRTDVTDADIRQASLDVKASSDLSHEEALTSLNAALAAIRIATERKRAAR